jgi:hypothetical protein
MSAEQLYSDAYTGVETETVYRAQDGERFEALVDAMIYNLMLYAMGNQNIDQCDVAETLRMIMANEG